MLGSNIMSVNYFNNYLFLTQMHSFWMFLSVATLCTLLATAEARDYLMDGILKYLESRTPKQQQQAMTTTQRPVLKNANSKMQNDNRIEEEEEPTDIQTNANTAFEICILLSPIILITLVLKKI